MTALRSETLMRRGEEEERDGGSKIKKRYFLKESLYLRNEMFVNVFLYHFKKKGSVLRAESYAAF